MERFNTIELAQHLKRLNRARWGVADRTAGVLHDLLLNELTRRGQEALKEVGL